jgi:hypothetical protein
MNDLPEARGNRQNVEVKHIKYYKDNFCQRENLGAFLLDCGHSFCKNCLIQEILKINTDIVYLKRNLSSKINFSISLSVNI